MVHGIFLSLSLFWFSFTAMSDEAGSCFMLLLCAAALSVLAAVVIAVGVVPAAERTHALVSLNKRLYEADCRVVAHVDVADEVHNGQRRYLAGLLVNFKTDRGLEVANATALANIEPERAWLTAVDRRRMYQHHPVGSSLQCTYDTDAPQDAVSTSGRIDDYGSRVTAGVLSTMAMGVVALLAAAPVLLLGSWVCALTLFYAGKWACGKCRWPLSLRAYIVLGSTASDASTGADPTDQEL